MRGSPWCHYGTPSGRGGARPLDAPGVPDYRRWRVLTRVTNRPPALVTTRDDGVSGAARAAIDDDRDGMRTEISPCTTSRTTPATRACARHAAAPRPSLR
ncbi:hypothetical protein GCM10009806_24460 [Microbacterium flavum]